MVVYFFAINLVVINRFRQYEALYFDHGIFDSSLWQVAHLQTPMIDHLEDGFISQFGDHFTPTFYLLAPVYWFTKSYEPILVVENLLVVSSAFVLYLIARKKIQNGLMVFAIILAYTLFIGLQNTIIANLHSELPALLTLSLTLWAIVNKRWRLYWLFLILTLGCKQNFAAVGVGLGIYIFFLNEKKHGLATIIFSLVYYVFATKVAIPLLGHRPYAYGVSLSSIPEMIKSLYSPPIKLETFFVSLATFGFLPFAALSFLPAVLQDFLTRFVFASPSRWDIGLHYNATLAVLLTFGAILGVSVLMRFNLYKKLIWFHALVIIAIVLIFHRFILHGPLGLAYNPDFYRHTSEMKFVSDFLKQIPPNKSVMTNNNLAPYLTHTNKVMLFSANRNPEVIAMDIRSGQNPVNFWPSTFAATVDLKNKLATDSAYTYVKISETQFIFVKK